jgi:hypothetical protein
VSPSIAVTRHKKEFFDAYKTPFSPCITALIFQGGNIFFHYIAYMVGLLFSIQKFDFEGDKGGVYPTASADSTAYHCK